MDCSFKTYLYDKKNLHYSQWIADQLEYGDYNQRSEFADDEFGNGKCFCVLEYVVVCKSLLIEEHLVAQSMQQKHFLTKGTNEQKQSTQITDMFAES